MPIIISIKIETKRFSLMLRRNLLPPFRLFYSEGEDLTFVRNVPTDKVNYMTSHSANHGENLEFLIPKRFTVK